MKTRFKRFFELDEDVVEEEVQEWREEPEPEEKPKAKKKQQEREAQNVVSLQSVQQSAKVELVEPRTYNDAQDIADHLKNRKTVVVNLQQISRDQALRIVDFLSGTVYAIGGDIQKVGGEIFLCAPENVDVNGSISEYMNGKQQEF